jgi:hypothetical protein
MAEGRQLAVFVWGFPLGQTLHESPTVAHEKVLRPAHNVEARHVLD